MVIDVPGCALPFEVTVPLSVQHGAIIPVQVPWNTKTKTNINININIDDNDNDNDGGKTQAGDTIGDDDSSENDDDAPRTPRKRTRTQYKTAIRDTKWLQYFHKLEDYKKTV